MANSAFFAERGIVLVVFFMAAHAVPGRLLEHGAFVAVFAFGLGVLAH